MNIRVLIKVISLFSALITLSLPGKTIELFDVETEKNSNYKNIILNKKIFSQKIKVSEQNLYKKIFKEILFSQNLNEA